MKKCIAWMFLSFLGWGTVTAQEKEMVQEDGTLASAPVSASVVSCSAMVSATERKEFMCHNLGAANTSADPLTPSWEINGGYWQWGRKEMAGAGPSGPGSEQAKEGAVAGWNNNAAPDGSWKEGLKTVEDPCPSGYRIPTKAEWEGALKYNVLSDVGTWLKSVTNYESGKKIGDQLFLPAAGRRDINDGALIGRGLVGFYWSRTAHGTYNAWGLYFEHGSTYAYYYNRTYGYSLRCIAD